MTINEILQEQLYGKQIIEEKEAKQEVAQYINETYNFFLGSERVKKLLESLDASLPYVAGIKKSVDYIVMMESKVLNEEHITNHMAEIILHDSTRYLLESLKTLEESVSLFKKADLETLSKVYATILFEQQMLGEEHGIFVKNLPVKNAELNSLIEKQFMYIVKEVL